MRFRGKTVFSSKYVSTCLYRHQLSVPVQWNLLRTYCTQQQSPKDEPNKMTSVKERTASALTYAGELGKQWGRNLVKTTTVTVNYWWERYEEFVGLNEVRDAQSNVTEAEKAFMIARGIVREAHTSLEALQVRLKEVRDRLDRVSREEAHYLELATLEHKLLQEERRFRTAYENAEEGEREKFALFSAAVRASHEKERTRAERTKNWSVIGSVLGAVIGVMGSTYINRVRLQELKSLLLEAQKGPVSLQEAIKVQASMHKLQQDELSNLIDSLRESAKGGVEDSKTVKKTFVPPATAIVPTPASSASEEAIQEILQHSQHARGLMESLKPQLEQLEDGVGKVGTEIQAVKTTLQSRTLERPVIQTRDTQLFVCDTEIVVQGLGHTEKRLEAHINKTSLYNTVLTCAAFAVTVPVLYIMLR
ncbi:mitochondrial potassium channel [Pimephales promelas]|uniref:mitochondrial potassium channel n=1 Tax=Pimephales promelas TaxID=90988 RepID=UPI00195574D3|nr:mitochondrial potassium channel [Pimephales promelas]XP_039538768.1 mitochondrial potassium channel [Pimephales promelas]KAG1946318.1 mitochondrial potassium channel [Pimephales promelas]